MWPEFIVQCKMHGTSEKLCTGKEVRVPMANGVFSKFENFSVLQVDLSEVETWVSSSCLKFWGNSTEDLSLSKESSKESRPWSPGRADFTRLKAYQSGEQVVVKPVDSTSCYSTHETQNVADATNLH